MSDVAVVNQKNEVAPIDGPEALIARAIDNNLPVETMERLLAMRNELKREQAREAYLSAMAGFQAECPIIHKNKQVMNKDGRSVRYSYAPLDEIVRQVGPILARHGLSYKVESKQDGDYLVVSTIVYHNQGHSEQSEFRVPVEKSQYMTSPQSFGSASTYAKRYSFCNALGILTGDEDNDGAIDPPSQPTPQPPVRNEAEEKILQSIEDCRNREELIAVWNAIPKEQVNRYLKAFKGRMSEITNMAVVR